jgi:hypothetical protein
MARSKKDYHSRGSSSPALPPVPAEAEAMRTTAMLAMTVGMAWNCAGATLDPAPPSTGPGVSICMKLGFDVQPLTLAEKRVIQMFAAIEVPVEWLQNGDSCERTTGVIVITLSYKSSPADHPDAWAYALPYEGTHIVVFWDRVQQKVPAGRAPILLAHVLVHEITHILEGVSRHSESGVMKAVWDEEDMFQMIKKPLSFTAVDVQLIRHGLMTRYTMAMNAAK